VNRGAWQLTVKYAAKENVLGFAWGVGRGDFLGDGLRPVVGAQFFADWG
jgi:hypothetical protein